MDTKKNNKFQFRTLLSALSLFGCLFPTLSSSAYQRKFVEAPYDDEDENVRKLEASMRSPVNMKQIKKNSKAEYDDDQENDARQYRKEKTSEKKEIEIENSDNSMNGSPLYDFVKDLEQTYRLTPANIDETFENVVTSGSVTEIELDEEMWADCASIYRRRSNKLTFNYDLYVKDKKLNNIITFEISLDDFMYSLSILCSFGLTPDKAFEKFKDMINSSVLSMCTEGDYFVKEKDFYQTLFKTFKRFVDKNCPNGLSGGTSTEPSIRILSLNRNEVFDLIRNGYLEKDNCVIQLEN